MYFSKTINQISEVELSFFFLSKAHWILSKIIKKLTKTSHYLLNKLIL